MKYYRNSNLSEMCWTLAYWRDELYSTAVDHIILYEQKRDVGSGNMWCSELECLVEKGDGSCGKHNCKSYKPRNGKSGMCKSLSLCFTDTGRIFILRQDKKITEVQR